MTSSSNFQSIFDAALSEYTKKTGIDLATYPFARALEKCNSSSDILDLLHGRATQFRTYRDGNHKLINYLKPVVQVLHSLSGVLAEASALLPFQPAKAILVGIDVLLSAAIGVSKSYDALVDLFECVESFLIRLRTYTEIPVSAPMSHVIVNIMVEVLSVLSLATKQIQEGRLKKYAKKLLGESEIEDVLQRVDRLTIDEARMTGAETLRVIHGLVTNMKLVMDDGKTSMDEIRKALVTIQETTSEINKMKRDQLQKDIRSWLSPPDPSINHNIARGAHHRGTAEWFTQGDIFERWKGSDSLLWIYGKPGSGKSILCSTIIQEVKAKSDLGLALMGYYYFDFKDVEKQGIRGLITSLLAQLCAKSNPCYEILSDLYSKNNAGSHQPDNEALTECLKKILTLPEQPMKYIIVDALDECPNTSGFPTAREEVLDFLEELVGLNILNLRICVTSRPEIDIRNVLEPLTTLQVSIHDEIGQKQDILEYINTVVHCDRRMRRWRSEDKQLVIDTLSAKADGMFRWVYCQLETLRRCFPTVIRRTLDELPETLDETYERTLLGIEKEKREFSHRLFQCLTVAVRPLRIDELAEVLAIRFDSGQLPKYHEDWRSEDGQEAVLSACSSLVAVVNVDGSPVVQFSHFSVKEFLTSDRLANSTENLSRYHVLPLPAHTILAQASLSVLLHLGASIDKHSVKKYPFAQYAAQHWVGHGQFDNVSSSIEVSMKRLFDLDEPSFSTWIWIYDIDYPSRPHMFEARPTKPDAVPLYYASLCGFHVIVEHLIVSHPDDVDSRRGRFGSPMNAALVGGNVEIALLLLEHGADVNALDASGDTPLHRATYSGRHDNVELLLKHHAYVDIQNSSGETALKIASRHGELEIARSLLQYGATVPSHGANSNNALVTASRSGHQDIVQLLIENGAVVDSEDNKGWTSLTAVSNQGRLDIMRLLIQNGAAVDSASSIGWTPLMSASRKGRLDAVRFLVQSGAAVGFRGSKGRAPLTLASGYGYLEVVRLLIQNGTAVDSPNDEGWTPLMSASRNGHSDVVRLLIQSGAAVDSLDNHGWTPLMSASACGHLDIVRLLIQSGATVDLLDNEGWTPLMSASRSGHLNIVRLLIQNGAAVNSRNNEGWTPLMSVSRNGDPDVVRLLVQSGATVNSPDTQGWTPLKSASAYGHLDMVRILIQNGAEVDFPDSKGWTPLMEASRSGRLHVAQELLDHGAAVNTQNTHLSTPLHIASMNGYLTVVKLLMECHGDVHKTDSLQQTPLHRASAYGHLEVVDLLLQYGSNPNSQDSNSSTPLHTAARHGHLGVVKLLLDSGADVNLRNGSKGIPLDVASASWNREVIKHLAKHIGIDTVIEPPMDEDAQNPDPTGAGLSSLGSMGHTSFPGNSVKPSLHTASWEGNLEIVQSLLDQGADVNERNEFHQTPVYLASIKGRLKVGRLLIKYGANVNYRDKNGWTPLHAASADGHCDFAELLLDHGADINARQQDLMTPLHIASWVYHVEVAKLLVDRGADIHLQDINGRTPYVLAARRGGRRISRLLSGHSGDRT